jgi:phospholipase C
MCTLDQTHGFNEIHGQWNEGAMDGFVRFGGPQTLAYYTGDEIGFYWALASQFTLCDRYFGSFIGGTFANRLYSYCASNGAKPGWPGVLNNPDTVTDEQALQLEGVPTILDRMGLPEDGPMKVTWKSYSVGTIAGASQPSPVESDNDLTFFPQYQANVRPLTFQRCNADISELELDLVAGQLPQVSWIVPEISGSEHPPFSVAVGMGFVASTLKLLMESSAWPRMIVIFSYDEAGGYYDHVPPPIVETKSVDVASQGVEAGTYAYGRGLRVPAMVLSPFARPGAIVSDVYDHTSALALIEARFDIDPLTALDAAADPFTACLDFSAPQPPVTIQIPDPSAGAADCGLFAPHVFVDGTGVPVPPARTYTPSSACAGVVGGEGNAPVSTGTTATVPRTGSDTMVPLVAAGALTAAALAVRGVSRGTADA